MLAFPFTLTLSFHPYLSMAGSANSLVDYLKELDGEDVDLDGDHFVYSPDISFNTDEGSKESNSDKRRCSDSCKHVLNI